MQCFNECLRYPEEYNMKSTLRHGCYKKIINIFFIITSILIVIPIVYILSISLSTNDDIIQYGYRLIPAHFSTSAYRYMLKDIGQLLNSYMVSIFVTVIGTFISLLLSTMLGYTISRADYRFKKGVTFYVFFTMLFNGGLVPTYILVSNVLHLRNTIWVLILPYLVNAWYVILLKGFLSSIPASLIESAYIDGAGEFRIFFRIIIPLSKPALAAIGVLIAFTYWNDWWLAMLYIEKQSLIPLQYMLYTVMTNIQFLIENVSATIKVNKSELPAEPIRMAMCLLAAGPMLFVFPFFQRYFVKGLTVGAVKG
jgi:putative aldouronate transport system permease protein